jgi:phosphoglycolate phosphatase-like HAD superfamily hydrolase
MGVAVAFDLDGTLIDLPVDLEPVRERILAMFRERGYRGEMRPILDSITRAASEVGEDPRDMGRLIGDARRMLDDAEVAAAARATPRPYARETVLRLQELRLPLGIVTNNGRACVGPALQVLGLKESDFVISTRDDVRRPKPAPDGLVRIAGHLASQGDLIWYIGDSPVDISAAVAANSLASPTIRAMAIPGPRSTHEQLRFAGPGAIFDHLQQALERILRG